jgi:F420-dependent oxidoreductase-like protein
MVPRMRIGIFLAYWPWFTLEQQIELSKLADESGIDSVWISEAWGYDAVSVLSHLAAHTERVGLGSGLLQIPARQPAATAMAAVTLDALSNGRFRLGLGVSGPQVSEGWYGVPFERPVTRTREYVDIIRKIVAREGPVDYQGKAFQLPVRDAGLGLGKPLKMLAHPVRSEIPIYLGAIGPKSVEMVGEIADGWLPFMLGPEDPEPLLEPLRRGLDKAGRTISDIDIAPCVPLAVHEDLDTARNLVRPWLAFYLGAMGAEKKNFYVELAERLGHGEAARECQRLFLSGDRIGAATSLPDEAIDMACIAATPAGLDDRLAAYESMGANTLVAVPCGDHAAVIRALAAAAGDRVG